MGFFDREQVPTFDFLAKHYLVCDRWFCSFPGHTQPNRYLTLGGAIASLVNFEFDDPQIGYLEFDQGTVFDLLDLFRRGPWVYYEQDVAFLRFYKNSRLNNREVIQLDDPTEGFFVRARNGTLPKVTFIDPNFVDIPPIRSANDDHAPADIALGQDMIARIYDCLVTSPQWPKTMFVITYDEHGGFVDHVPPGHARGGGARETARNSSGWTGFPWPPCSRFRNVPLGGQSKASHVIFDHASIMKTIVLKFMGPQYLRLTSRRVRNATQLGVLLDEPTPRTDRPTLNASELSLLGLLVILTIVLSAAPDA